MRNVDIADLAHALFAFFLLLQQLLFTRRITTIALGRDVLAKRRNGFARDDFAADGCLNGNFEHLAWDQRFQLFAQGPPAVFRLAAVNHDRQGIDRIAVDQDAVLTKSPAS